MADVFISYKSERRPAISHLARVIENHGYSVWFDYALMPGGSFSAQIERELRAARAVIVVWCSMSTRSVEGKTNWVVEEADLAKDLDKYLPVWIEPVDLPLGFRMDEVIDIADWNGDPRSHDIDRLIEKLSLKIQRDPDVNYKALVAQSADVRRTGLTNLAAYPLDKQGAQLAARKREREQREKEEAEQIAEIAREEEAARLAAEKALADAKARLEAEQRLKQEEEASEALAKAEQARLQQLAEEERPEAEPPDLERKDDALPQQLAERQNLDELQQQQEGRSTVRDITTEERQPEINQQFGGAQSLLAEHRTKILGALGVLGAVALAGALSQTGDVAAQYEAYTEADAVEPMVGPENDAMAEAAEEVIAEVEATTDEPASNPTEKEGYASPTAPQSVFDTEFAPGISIEIIKRIVPKDLQSAAFLNNGSTLNSSTDSIAIIQGLWIYFEPGEEIRPCLASDSMHGHSVKGSVFRYFQIGRRNFVGGGQHLIRFVNGNVLVMNDGTWGYRIIDQNRFEAVRLSGNKIFYTAIRCS
jgi:hypothetical protein